MTRNTILGNISKRKKVKENIALNYKKTVDSALNVQLFAKKSDFIPVYVILKQIITVCLYFTCM